LHFADRISINEQNGHEHVAVYIREACWLRFPLAGAFPYRSGRSLPQQRLLQALTMHFHRDRANKRLRD